MEWAMEEVQPMGIVPSYEFLDSVFEKEALIQGFKVIQFVINNFFLSFEISGGLYSFTKYYQRDWGLDYVFTQFHDFTKMYSFSWSFEN